MFGSGDRKPPPHRRALLFVDNSGADIVLGMLPLARELLRRGTEVSLVVSNANNLLYLSISHDGRVSYPVCLVGQQWEWCYQSLESLQGRVVLVLFTPNYSASWNNTVTTFISCPLINDYEIKHIFLAHQCKCWSNTSCSCPTIPKYYWFSIFLFFLFLQINAWENSQSDGCLTVLM